MAGPPSLYGSTETFYQAPGLPSRRLRSVVILGALVMALIGAGTVEVLFHRPQIAGNRDASPPRPPSGKEKTIAVLPSDSLETQESDRDFPDGIREGILSNLTKVPDLKIVSGNNVERYRENEKRTEEIGAPLKVQDPARARAPKQNVPVKITAETSSKVTDQAATDEKTPKKNGKERIWIPKQIGSNLPAHWADANSPEALEARTTGRLSSENIRKVQDQGVSSPTTYVGARW